MGKSKKITILGIETSCDDTCAAVLEAENSKFSVLSSVVSSQEKLHEEYGGVYPTLAKREHQKNLPVVLAKALKKAGFPEVDLVAVTAGPGLEPCLWTGINFAKDFSKKNQKPIIPVNHIEAHILANYLLPEFSKKKKLFPAVCLVVSGGHTQLILMEGIGKYKVLGETRDDAAGECFDKTARILGLGYPGGPILAQKASEFKGKKPKFNISLPRPMLKQKNYDFSFSGLKTAVLYDFKGRSEKTRKSKEYIGEIAVKIQQAIIDVLISKTLKAVKDYKSKSIILGGGVSANQELQKQLSRAVKKELPRSSLSIPNLKLCTDNAVMIAVAGYYRRLQKKNWKKIQANANLRIGNIL